MSLAHITEEQDLLLRLKRGDERAFAEIYGHYHEFLFIHAHKLTREEQEARDIVQEIFINLWTNREKTEIRGNLLVYLNRSVHHGFLKQLRSRSVRTRYEEDLKHFMDAGKCTTDEQLLEKELIARLERLAAALPSKMGQAFVLRHLDQRSVAEIAAALNVSEKTVSNLLSQASKNIRLKIGMGIFMAMFF